MSAAYEQGGLMAEIANARQRSLAWFKAREVMFDGVRLWAESSEADPANWPGMVLPGTYNSALCLRLIGGLDDMAPERLSAAADWIDRQRHEDGSWWLQGMAEDAVYKKPDRVESLNYVRWHIANYTLGALQALGRQDPGQPTFIEPWLDEKTLGHWLSRRDMREPWLEGNNVVNIGSFLLLVRDHGTPDRAEAASARLDQLMEWHFLNSEPATGFWGVHQTDPIRAIHAMAGATHNYHLFYELEIEIPHHQRAVDYCLGREPRAISACIDADLVDILAHAFHRLDYRRDEIAQWLATIANAILAIQNTDGGFPDQPVSEDIRRFDGWRDGYSEPQGMSCAFGTFFRWIALAMTAQCLEPGAHDWQFRSMPGLGYFNGGARRNGIV